VLAGGPTNATAPARHRRGSSAPAGFTHLRALFPDRAVDGGNLAWVASTLGGTLQSIASFTWPFTNVVDFNVGVALPPDGTVTGGYAPAELRSVTAIAVGRLHALALKRDGTVVQWSLCDAMCRATRTGRLPAEPPSGVAGIVAVAIGDTTSYALKADGTLQQW
jgi:hypothetical protein